MQFTTQDLIKLKNDKANLSAYVAQLRHNLKVYGVLPQDCTHINLLQSDLTLLGIEYAAEKIRELDPGYCYMHESSVCTCSNTAVPMIERFDGTETEYELFVGNKYSSHDRLEYAIRKRRVEIVLLEEMQRKLADDDGR